jgi:hypothetical protein
MIRFFNLLLCCAGSAAANLHLANDSATGEPGKFAAEEIRREAAAKGMASIAWAM